MVKTILLMDPEKLIQETPKIIGRYPNTYAFSKALTELILSRRKGSVNMCFVRPTIVGCSWKGNSKMN